MLADELHSSRCKNGSRYFAHPGSNVASYNWRYPLAAKGVVCSQENTLSQSQQAGQLPKVWFSFFSAVKYEVSQIITFLLPFFRAIPFWCLLIPFCCCYAFWVFASLFVCFFKKNKRFFFFFVVMVVHFSKIMWTQQHFGEAVLQPRLLQNLLLPRRSQLYLYIHIKAVHFEHPEDQNFRGEETHGAWEGQQLFPAHTTTQPLYLSGCKCGSSKGKSANGSCSPRCHEDNLAFEGAHSPWQLLPRGDALSLSFSSVWLHLLSAEIDLSSTGRNCWKAQRKNLAEARLGAKSCLCTSMQEAAAQNRSLGGGYFGKATTDWGKACVGQGLAPNSVTNRHKSTEPASLAASLA